MVRLSREQPKKDLGHFPVIIKYMRIIGVIVPHMNIAFLRIVPK